MYVEMEVNLTSPLVSISSFEFHCFTRQRAVYLKLIYEVCICLDVVFVLHILQPPVTESSQFDINPTTRRHLVYQQHQVHLMFCA